MKRLFDITFVIITAVAWVPICVFIALICLFAFGRPILFKQVRSGLSGKPFNLYKFRTMTSKCDGNNHLLPDRDRLTSFGKFLRKTSLDELPELWNVLMGEMMPGTELVTIERVLPTPTGVARELGPDAPTRRVAPGISVHGFPCATRTTEACGMLRQSRSHRSVDAVDGHPGDLPKAQYQQASPGSPYLSVLVAQSGD